MLMHINCYRALGFWSCECERQTEILFAVPGNIFHNSFESDEMSKCVLTKHLKKHDLTAEETQSDSHTFCYRVVTIAPPDGGEGIC